MEEAAKLGVFLTEDAADKLFAYKEFLKEYNTKVNLTSITDDEEIIIKHFLDSLTLMEYVDGGRLIDIGTGAGFPGVVLKIAAPHLDIVLMDSLNKRIKFLEQLVNILGITGISCIHGRAEELARRPEYHKKFDFATARAVTNLTKLAEYCLPYVKSGGMFLAMKGRNYHEETNEAKPTINRLGGRMLPPKEIVLPGGIVHTVIPILK